MSHIDEGRIAAYLDGELPAGSGELVEIELHVEACAECRKLLEESLRERNRARGILRSGTASTIEAPGFDEILRRAGKGANARGVAQQRSRLASLAWAATIVLAVGAGWYVTQDRGRGPIANAIRKLRPATQAPSEPTMVLAEKNAAEPAADARREEPAAAPVAPPLVAQAPAGARADEAARPVTPAPANQPPPTLAIQERPTTLDTALPAKANAPPATAQALASAANRDRDSAALDRMAKSRLTADAGTVAGQVAAEQKKAESVATAADAPVALRGRAAAAPTGAPAPAAAAPAPPAWRETSQGGAMRQLGRLPLQVPDLPVLAYYVRPSGAGEIRVTHDLGGGQVLEIIQEKIGADSSAKLERQNEVGFAGSQVAQETDGFKTTLRGPLSRDSLAVLLQKLR